MRPYPEAFQKALSSFPATCQAMYAGARFSRTGRRFCFSLRAMMEAPFAWVDLDTLTVRAGGEAGGSRRMRWRGIAPLAASAARRKSGTPAHHPPGRRPRLSERRGQRPQGPKGLEPDARPVRFRRNQSRTSHAEGSAGECTAGQNCCSPGRILTRAPGSYWPRCGGLAEGLSCGQDWRGVDIRNAARARHDISGRSTGEGRVKTIQLPMR